MRCSTSKTGERVSEIGVAPAECSVLTTPARGNSADLVTFLEASIFPTLGSRLGSFCDMVGGGWTDNDVSCRRYVARAHRAYVNRPSLSSSLCSTFPTSFSNPSRVQVCRFLCPTHQLSAQSGDTANCVRTHQACRYPPTASCRASAMSGSCDSASTEPGPPGEQVLPSQFLSTHT